MTAQENRDQSFVEFIAKELVEKPEKVVVKRSVDEMGVLIELTVDKDDMGVIIGKEGKTAKAIRTLLRVLGAKNDARVNLKIVEPEGSEEYDKRKKEVREAADAEAEEAQTEENPSTIAQDEADEQVESTEEAESEAEDQPKDDDFVDI